mmetsp:Transcript_114465/g.323637  ORF Transcript_114465/g.323637 Transcript_114465/m.323637 type:complete len:398 (+) Transcript_114465:176-1369(+)
MLGSASSRLPVPAPLTMLLLFIGLAVAMVLLLVVALLGRVSAPHGRGLAGRVTAVVLITLELALFGGEWYAYHIACQPYASSSFPTWAGCFDVAMTLTVWSFLCAALTDPGTCASPEWEAWARLQADGAKLCLDGGEPGAAVVEEPWNDEPMEECVLGGPPSRCCSPGESFSIVRLRREWQPGKVSRCQLCKRLRPERAHHCKSCNACVLRMDHHCPLVGNCVGWRNHKYFLLLLFWQLVACFVNLATPDGPLARVLRGPAGLWEFWPVLALTIAVAWAVILLVITLVSLPRNLLMALRNVTCIEMNYEGPNPYLDKVGWYGSLRQLLGEPAVPCLWFLPVEAKGRRCSGTEFAATDVGDGQGVAKSGPTTKCSTSTSAEWTVTQAPSFSYGSVAGP